MFPVCYHARYPTKWSNRHISAPVPAPVGWPSTKSENGNFGCAHTRGQKSVPNIILHHTGPFLAVARSPCGHFSKFSHTIPCACLSAATRVGFDDERIMPATSSAPLLCTTPPPFDVIFGSLRRSFVLYPANNKYPPISKFWLFVPTRDDCSCYAPNCCSMKGQSSHN